MGDVQWFLGVSFEWTTSQSGELLVHLNQAAFAQFLVDKFGLSTSNKSPRGLLPTVLDSPLILSQKLKCPPKTEMLSKPSITPLSV
eukprot:scaffold76105_cov69-Attheya_sp.AAC.3